MGLSAPHSIERLRNLKRPFVLVACQSIDFFGDAAVCLRLAQGLVSQGAQVRILAEHRALGHLLAMAPDYALEPSHGFIQTSPLAYWSLKDLLEPDHGLPIHQADLFLEAFQTQVPQSILAQLPDGAIRYCVDYLAFENWSEECQWLSAPDPGLSKCKRYWAAPSFHKKGPGFIKGGRLGRGDGPVQGNRQALRQRMIQRARLSSEPALHSSGLVTGDDSVFLVFAYCYPSTPLHDFLNGLTTALGQLKVAFDKQALGAGSRTFYRVKRVVLFEPDQPTDNSKGLLSQREFDDCMAACDLALVRGEDSLGTALFCAAAFALPFVWQPYRQPDDAHLVKLEAWLGQAESSVPAWTQLHHFFSPCDADSEGRRDTTETLLALLSNWQALKNFCQLLGQEHLRRSSFEESLLAHWHSKRRGC